VVHLDQKATISLQKTGCIHDIGCTVGPSTIDHPRSSIRYTSWLAWPSSFYNSFVSLPFTGRSKLIVVKLAKLVVMEGQHTTHTQMLFVLQPSPIDARASWIDGSSFCGGGCLLGLVLQN
jgi:hypothetical protein